MTLSAMALACGADHGMLEGPTSDVPAAEEQLAPYEAGAAAPEDIEALKAGVITPEENERLAAYFEVTGRQPTAIEGRILHWDDAWSTVGDALSFADLARDAALTDKAYVNTGNYNPPTSTNSNFQFLRPDIGRPIWFIVPDSVPNAVFNALRDVVAEYGALNSDDCLFSSVLLVTRQSSYNALSTAMKEESYEVQFRWITRTTSGWACTGSNNACMAFPRAQNVFVYLDSTTRVQQTRTTIGNFLHMDSNVFTAANSTEVAQMKRVMRHEIGHGFGFDHSAGPDSLTIHHLPGTASCGSCLGSNVVDSVMRQGGRDSFTADDIKAFATLYDDVRASTADDCGYVSTFRSLSALP